jgi:DNA topoisomerase I
MSSIAVIEGAGAAKSAGLRYVSDDTPGITRQKTRGGFRYLSPGGKPITADATLARIRSLAIPPAWTDVWICPLENGHLQATGRDARGRKQHRYHPEWRALRDQNKYERMIAFGQALPAMRRKVNRDLKRRGLGREKILAAVTRLLEATLIRVGNEEYARQNGSFGLSTLRDRHVKIKGANMHFDFRGKSGKRHAIDLHDPQLAKIVRGAQELPGQTLFQYTDEAGAAQKITSEDVNAYLRGIAGEEFSAKDFRTWAATVLAAEVLREFERFDSKTQAKKNVLRAIESVASRLGNTPAICRKSYIHPAVLNSYLDGLTLTVLEKRANKTLRNNLEQLSPIEAAVLTFLQQQLHNANQGEPTKSLLKRRPKALAAGRRATLSKPRSQQPTGDLKL